MSTYFLNKLRQWLIENCEYLPAAEVEKFQRYLDSEETRPALRERVCDPAWLDSVAQRPLKPLNNHNVFMDLPREEKIRWVKLLHKGINGFEGIGVIRLSQLFGVHRRTIRRWLNRK
ncbi:MAG: hypothetical protein DRZ76_03350 [Candidatus Nealsonbacteria bacterium]|nr:MAG: hypothetical protein DRZ76_03350 [Candidatus Nealsonbacteria bacterium]